jgi:hypothetical protein
VAAPRPPLMPVLRLLLRVLVVVEVAAEGVAQQRPVAAVPEVAVARQQLAVVREVAQRLVVAVVQVAAEGVVQRRAVVVAAEARRTRRLKPRLLRPSEPNILRPRQWSWEELRKCG